MPTYQYECSQCGHHFETFQSMMDKKIKKCPKCGKMKLNRLLGTGGGIIFKGSGFYETDYKRKTPPGSTGKKSAEGSKKNSSKSSPTQTGSCTNCSCKNTH